jgi:hypothetical protein
LWAKLYGAIIGLGCFVGAGYGLIQAKCEVKMLKEQAKVINMRKGEFIWVAGVFTLWNIIAGTMKGGLFAALFPISIPATIVYGNFYESE